MLSNHKLPRWKIQMATSQQRGFERMQDQFCGCKGRAKVRPLALGVPVETLVLLDRRMRNLNLSRLFAAGGRIVLTDRDPSKSRIGNVNTLPIALDNRPTRYLSRFGNEKRSTRKVE